MEQFRYQVSNEIKTMIAKGMELLEELRYQSVNHYCLKTGYREILDLGCGISPRGAYMVEERGLHYVGADFPATIEASRKAVQDKTCYKIGRLQYTPIDLTSTASMYRAAEELKGPLTIISEGSIFHYNGQYLRMALENINHLLRAKGGCWISTDFYENEYLKAVLVPLIGAECFQSLIDYDQLYALTGTTKSGSFLYSDRMLRDYELNPQRFPLVYEGLELNALSTLPEEQARGILEGLNGMMLNVVVPKVIEHESRRRLASDAGLSFSCNLLDGTAVINLNGRLDTSTAPSLQSYFKHELSHGEVSHIVIDCEQLAYLSSAGIQVWMSMRKKMHGSLEVQNMNPVVRDVLEQSGMDVHLVASA